MRRTIRWLHQNRAICPVAPSPKLNTLLRCRGRAAIQTTVIDDAHFERYRVNTDFIQQYIFSGSMLPSLCKLKEVVIVNGFRIGRCDAFGRQYAKTLCRWRCNFEDKLDHTVQLVLTQALSSYGVSTRATVGPISKKGGLTWCSCSWSRRWCCEKDCNPSPAFRACRGLGSVFQETP